MSEHQHASNTIVNVGMVLFISAVLIFGGWYLLQKPIMWLSFYISYYMFGLYEMFPYLMTGSELQAIQAARKLIPTIRPADYGIGSLMQLFEYHGYFWRWLVIPALLYWGWRIKKSTVRFMYRRNLRDVYDLIEIQSKHFPASAIIKGKELLKTHPYVGPWATYALPLDFALDNKLLWASRSPVDPEVRLDTSKMLLIPAFKPEQKVLPFPLKRKLLPHYTYVGFDIDGAHSLFVKQLGPLWKGTHALPPLERALYAIFLAQANGKAGEAAEKLMQIASSFVEGKRDKNGLLISPHAADLTGIDQMIEKYQNHGKAKRIVETHAHVYNVMEATLVWARSKGRMMHSNFLWLKPVNRTLWYVLCGSGGQCPYWEAAGPWAHRQIEFLYGKKVETPAVLGAIDALKDTMSREHWIDPGEYSEAAQQELVRQANATLEAETQKTAAAKHNAQRRGGVQTPPRQPSPAKSNPEDDAP